MNLTLQEQADIRMFLIEWDRTGKEAEYAKNMGLDGEFIKQKNIAANRICEILLPKVLEE